MLVFKEEHITEDRINQERMIWEFKGTNTYDQTILIEAKAACGCSGVNSGFKVKAGEDFTLVGFLNKRSKAGSYTKGVTVRAYETKLIRPKQLEMKKLNFTINVQDPVVNSKS